MLNTVKVKGDNAVDQAKRVQALQKLANRATTQELEKLAKLLDDTKKRNLLKLA